MFQKTNVSELIRKKVTYVTPRRI